MLFYFKKIKTNLKWVIEVTEIWTTMKTESQQAYLA